ncbi:MAG: WHG domain-containing protein [Clostridia bacterium]|jgi:AcrR family transcriptional regulator|nr:WHG domain-containing protein [Clostridia bacterium]
MPPKAKFTKEQVVHAAMALIREGSPVTARELGAKLGSSARPIFTLFESMEEVVQETRRAVRDLYNGYIDEGLKEPIAFKGVGRAYIRFAVEQPQFFRMLFTERHAVGFQSVLSELDEKYAEILSSVTNRYGVDQKTANALYRHLWVYTHGIASLCASGTCAFTEAQTDGMLTDIFVALLAQANRGELK